MKNESGIQPMADNVVVAPKVVEEKTAGGLYLPEHAKEREQFAQMQGVLVAKSAGAFGYNYPDWPEGAEVPQEGQTVLFSKYQATEVEGVDGKKYWLMKDTSIAGVMA